MGRRKIRLIGVPLNQIRIAGPNETVKGYVESPRPPLEGDRLVPAPVTLSIMALAGLPQHLVRREFHIAYRMRLAELFDVCGGRLLDVLTPAPVKLREELLGRRH